MFKKNKFNIPKIVSTTGCHGNVPQQLWTYIYYMIPMAHPKPQPKLHVDRFSCFCTDDCRVSLYFIKN